jgi:hypothetical protein
VTKSTSQDPQVELQQAANLLQKHAIKDAKTFLEAVVPEGKGHIVVQWKNPDGKWPSRSFQTIVSALALIDDLKTRLQHDIYFCLSAQKLNTGQRLGENALAFNALWADLDVDPADPNKYASIEEALADLFVFCDALKLPRPSIIVASGHGIHAYWLSDRILTVEQWQPFANTLRAAAQAAGLKIDGGVTTDAARILRIPDTKNWKDPADPQPVRLLLKYCNGIRHDFRTFFSELNEPIPEKIEIAQAFKDWPLEHLGQGIVLPESPLLPLAPILVGCGWVREAHDTGGESFNNPQWSLATLCTVFMENGHELAHAFARRWRDAKGNSYSYEETEALWERKNREHEEKDVGWPSCKAIQAAGSKHCATCPHLDKGGSPLHLAEQERRARQLAENIRIGEEVTESLLPQVMTLEEMLDRLVFIGSIGAVADLATVRVRKKEHAMDEYAASLHTYVQKNAQGQEVVKIGPALKHWIASKNRMNAEVLAWVPGGGQICSPPEGPGPAFNMWRGLPSMAYPEDWQERVKPFLDHVEYLVPIEAERERFLQWLAHIDQCPEVLPHTGYLMITPTTGVGRNLLASILVRALRGFVAAGISLPELLDGGFTGRLSKKLFTIVDEAREGSGERRYQRATRLTSLLNEEHRHVNPKYGHQSVEKNCGRWLMFSNYQNAIPFDNADRRIIVIANPTERKSDAYYARLYGLLNDNAFIGSVRRWLETKDISAFRPGEHAPMNAAKQRALDEMMSEVERAVAEFKEDCETELTSRNMIKDRIRLDDMSLSVNDTHLTHAINRAKMMNTGRRIRAYYKNEGGYVAEKRFSVVIVRGEWTIEIVKKASVEKLLEAMGLQGWSATKLHK